MFIIWLGTVKLNITGKFVKWPAKHLVPIVIDNIYDAFLN